MATSNLPDPAKFIGLTVGNHNVIEKTLSVGPTSGKNGIVYEGYQNIAGHRNKVAIKCIPRTNLRVGWDSEIKKPLLLPPSTRVVRPISVETYTPAGEIESFIFVIMPWIDGMNLRTYLKKRATSITHLMCGRFAKDMLSFLHAMQVAGIAHGDIHAGNILVEAPNPSYIDGHEHFWLTDFGIGNSLNNLRPKDDYVETGHVIGAVADAAECNVTDGHGRYVIDHFRSDILPRLTERNPTSLVYRQPKEICNQVDALLDTPLPDAALPPQKNLATPFDYMSCEQLGQQYGLLQRLFSLNFPNCPDLLERCNTVLTGPRGCGKTMILRSLATKAKVLGGKQLTLPLERFGVYYHCNDLFYAFPYMRRQLEEATLRGTVHYFNFALLYETIDTLQAMARADSRFLLASASVQCLTEWLRPYLPDGWALGDPKTALSDLKSQVASVRRRAKDDLNRERTALNRSSTCSGLDFISELSHLLGESITWLKDVPLFIFLDDYSTPRVSQHLQASLNRVIFQREAETFFKVATESITTLHPYDSEEKLLEVEREYSVIDLGTAFMTAEPSDKQLFIEEVINTRFEAADAYALPTIRNLLGDPDDKYNDIARALRDKKQQYKYRGLKTVVDMCSGDITHTLRLIRDMVANSGGLERFRKMHGVLATPPLPIEDEIQNKAILKLGADFLSNIEAAPKHGPRVRQIVDAFGGVAHWELMNLESPNEGTNPPKQSFRIEIREAWQLGPDDHELGEVYDTLLRYGVFVRDVTGKSLRSAVVPRLYLRRLLVPLFRLTFSKRDNIGLEVQEFRLLLQDPPRFKAARIARSKQPASLTLPFTPPKAGEPQ